MTETTVNVQPSAERDLGRVEGKMDILLATVSRMEQAATTSAELISQRFLKVDERISRVQREAAEERKRIDDRVSTLRTRILIGAAAVSGAAAAISGSAKTVFTAILHMAV